VKTAFASHCELVRRRFLTAVARPNKLPVAPAGGEDGGNQNTMHPLENERVDVSCVLKTAAVLLVIVGFATGAKAQTCLTAEDMEPAVRSALETTAKRYYDLVSKVDVATLRQNAIPGVASDFGGIEGAIRENQANFAGATATVRPPFVLEADGKEPLQRAEFLCGVFGKSGQTSNSAVFVIPNLPPGTYAVTILEVAAKSPSTLSFVLQKSGNDWKLAGFYARAAQVAGHDGPWFANQAKDFKSKGQNRNAWFYYQEARELLAPVPFMSTMVTDKIYDDMQSVQPTDLPAAGNTVNFVVDGKTYKLTAAFLVGVGNDLDLVVKYAVPDVSNSNQIYQQNVALIKALAAKFPELRNGFTAIVARGVEPSGRDYGTMNALKDVK
jgi:hypothetical protein